VALPNPRTTPDFDGDGTPSVEAGGTDCDDSNKDRAPARTEKADATDIDEYCNPTTYGRRDDDNDGAPDARACNVGIRRRNGPQGRVVLRHRLRRLPTRRHALRHA
jgi:hypothetical protein